MSPEPSPPSVELAPLDDRRAAAVGLNDFTFALYGETRQPHNVCLSPFSAGVALSLLHLGARGSTEDQLGKALGLPATEPHAAIGSLLAQSGGGTEVEKFGEKVPPHELSVANSLWVKQGYPIDPAYLDGAVKFFDSHVEEIDVTKPAQSAKTINDWTSAKTKDKIKDLVSEASIVPLTRLIIVNAVYLKAFWREPFNEGGTKPAPFTTEGGSKIEVPTMHMMGNLAYAKTDDAHVLELDYWPAEGAELSMVLALPFEGKTLTSLEEGLDAKRFDGWLGALQTAFVEVALPKFRIESSFELREPLGKVGLGNLFTEPDLSGISAESGLHVDEVIQKTFIDVDEKGTEAAAATAIMLAGSGMPTEPPRFIADRPFLYAIREKQTGAILFIGRVADPS